MFCSALTFHFLSFSWYPWEYYLKCRCGFPHLAFSLSIGLDFPMWLTSMNTNNHEGRICLGHHRTPRTWHKVWRWWVINYNHWNCVSSFLSIAFWAPTSYHISVRPITSLDSQPLQNSWFIYICKRCIDNEAYGRLEDGGTLRECPGSGQFFAQSVTGGPITVLKINPIKLDIRHC